MKDHVVGDETKKRIVGHLKSKYRESKKDFKSAIRNSPFVNYQEIGVIMDDFEKTVFGAVRQALGGNMAKLKAAARNKLKTSQFAGPDRSYPVNDKAHAANAKARATQMVAKGKLSPSTASQIKAKANKVLGKK